MKLFGGQKHKIKIEVSTVENGYIVTTGKNIFGSHQNVALNKSEVLILVSTHINQNLTDILPPPPTKR